MAGHSHWAGIKHKKGRADKERSKIFSKLSREITVAAKLGDKDPSMNPRLRTAIQAAKQANMPKDNISRAISKSEMSGDKNYENLRYEGFGPSNIALIIETLTDNKNRSASSIRTVLQKKKNAANDDTYDDDDAFFKPFSSRPPLWFITKTFSSFPLQVQAACVYLSIPSKTMMHPFMLPSARTTKQ